MLGRVPSPCVSPISGKKRSQSPGVTVGEPGNLSKQKRETPVAVEGSGDLASPVRETHHQGAKPARGVMFEGVGPDRLGSLTATLVDTEIVDYSELKTPPRSPIRTEYGRCKLSMPTTYMKSPGGTKNVTLLDGSRATITNIELGSGTSHTAYSGVFTSPGGHEYPTAVISYPPYTTVNQVHGHDEQFGHVRNLSLQDETITLTRRGITFDAVVQNLSSLGSDDAVKAAFLVKYLQLVNNSLIAIEGLGYCHQDTKPQNMVIFGPGSASMIDINDIPVIGARRYGRTPNYSSPSKALSRPASPQSDVYALGTIISEWQSGALRPGFDQFSSVELTALVTRMRGEKTSRPSLRESHDQLGRILSQFLDQNDGGSRLADLETAFFTSVPEIAVREPVPSSTSGSGDGR